MGDPLKKELHLWGHSSSCGEDQWGEISMLDLVNPCFVFANFLLLCIVEETLVRLVEVASGYW